MTKREYELQYKELRRQLSVLTLEQQKELRKVYLKAASGARNTVKEFLSRGYSKKGLTALQWRSLEAELRGYAKLIGDAVDKATKSAIHQGVQKIKVIERDYIREAAKDIGLKITPEIFDSIYISVDQRLMLSLVTTMYQDGKTYSERIWGETDMYGAAIGVSGDWIRNMKLLIGAGLAQGRDAVEIGQDLTRYTVDGVGTIGRWGKLEPGTKEFVQRMGAGVDYRALRLVRTEMYAAMQKAGELAAKNNPACDGYVDWVLQAVRENWKCLCPSIAAAGPYKIGNVPAMPHPNCGCITRPRLKDMKEFRAEIARYRDGDKDSDFGRWMTKFAA